MRRRAWVAGVLWALLLTVTPAAAQTVTLSDAEGTVDQTVDAVTSTTTDVGDAVEETADTVTSTTTDVGDAVEETADTVTSTAGEAGGTVQGAAASATGSSGTSVTSPAGGTSGGATGSTFGGGSTSSGSTTSSNSSGSSARSGSGGGRKADSRATRQRTKFDRLPRRFETLLERIEFGRNVRANLRRLERLFASASPALRARVLRLLRAESQRLRADGVTAAERSRIERLQLVRRALLRATPTTAPAATTSSGSAPLHASPALREADESLGTRARPRPTGEGGVLAEQTGGGRLGAQAGGDRGADAGPLAPMPQIPDPPDEFPFAIGLILLVLVGLGLAGVVAGVAAHVLGRARSS